MKKIKASMFVKSTFPSGSVASHPALIVEQNNQKIYLSSIPVADIFPFCFVTRRAEDPIAGFQRNLSEERALDIAKYLDEQGGSIPTNIILSAQEYTDFQFDEEHQEIGYKRVFDSFLVIDGQHRLFGYGLTKKNHYVPVAIYANLTRKEEAALFIDINTTQRGVPAALLLDIKQVAEKENEKEALLRILFDKLNSDSESPLAGLLSPADNKIGKISRVTFNRCTVPQKLDTKIMFFI